MADDPLLLGPLPVIFAALIGAALGSFLNVCIVRWGAEPKESVVRPPSRCPRCGKGIAWHDNVPVASWLILRGRCRGCALPISPLYPLVELGTALAWGYLAWRYGLTVEALRGAVFLTLLLGIACTDARAYIIPDEFTLGGTALGLLLALAAGGTTELARAAIGAGVGFGLVWGLGAVGTWVFKKDAMGGGDIKMMAMVGAFLGAPSVLATLFLGAVVGLVLHAVALLLRTGRAADRSPAPVSAGGPADARSAHDMSAEELRDEGYLPFGISLAIAAALILVVIGPATVDLWFAEYWAGIRLLVDA